jgi:molecular chaperone HtpG
MVDTEVRSFETESKDLLQLMIHSLYTRKDIFLRELISNASDALERLRFESLSNAEILEGNDKFEIRLEADPAARTLTIRDTGIGMSREEVISHIGTIAKSGTAEMRRRLRESGNTAELVESIGQFGVGFYSAFMVAERVRLVTRRAGETAATEWESTGEGTYSIKPAEKDSRGTDIILYLRKPDPDNGIEDYAQFWQLSKLVKQHSDFIAYPILARRDEKSEEQTLNSMKPIWKRSPSEVTAEEYNEFYKHIAHDWTEPLRHVHFKAEGTFEYDALLYVPAHAPHDLFHAQTEAGMRLFAKRVMIVEKCEDLLPHYFRFIRGVVDAADLPLNISRQRLQQDHHITAIRKRLTRKLLDSLQDLLDKEPEQYLKVWHEFGRAMKEGVPTDFENKDRVVNLLLFASSHDAEKLTTLKEYVARMQESQKEIYYLSGPSRAVIENSPHLEALKARGYEVLYMTDPIDEWALASLTEFEGKPMKSAGKGEIELDENQEQAEMQRKAFEPLTQYLRNRLQDDVKEVRISQRLTSSPVCLIVDEDAPSPMLEQLLQRTSKAPRQKRILELNPKHPVIARLQHRLSEDPNDPVLPEMADMLHGLALLVEGSPVPDTARFHNAALGLLGRMA